MRVLVLLLVAGLCLPRMGAVLAEGLGLEQAVICVGDRLVAVHLGADGAPVEVAEAHDCAPAPPVPAAGAPTPRERAAWTVAETAPATPAPGAARVAAQARGPPAGA